VATCGHGTLLNNFRHKWRKFISLVSSPQVGTKFNDATFPSCWESSQVQFPHKWGNQRFGNKTTVFVFIFRPLLGGIQYSKDKYETVYKFIIAARSGGVI